MGNILRPPLALGSGARYSKGQKFARRVMIVCGERGNVCAVRADEARRILAGNRGAQVGKKGRVQQPLCLPCNVWKGTRDIDFRTQYTNG